MFRFIYIFRQNINTRNNAVKGKILNVYDHLVIAAVYFCNLLVSTFRIGLKTVCAPSGFLAANKNP